MSARKPRRRRIIAGALLGCVVLGGAAYGLWVVAAPAGPEFALPPELPAASAEQVQRFCGACHALPPPDSFPRHEWRKQVSLGYALFRESNLAVDYPPIESVCLFYERLAPEKFPPLPTWDLSEAAPVRWERKGHRLPGRSAPGVTHLNVARLSDVTPPGVLVCDAQRHEVLALRPGARSTEWQTLARVKAPAHAEVSDLDADGVKDVLVASLGSFYPTDARVGAVVWLRGRRDGGFTAVPLLQNVARVADVQVADFNGDGKLDLVVAVFGWNRMGEILYLENQTVSWEEPRFVSHVVDERHGAIHVPVADLNGDGRPDFVALISQEHETVVAFLNEGGRFRKATLYAGPHPAFGSSGLQLADLDGDGDHDVLYTNGDVMDPPHLPRPDHQVHWLENRTTDWTKPGFVPRSLAVMPGVERAVAADVDGDGDLDVVAVSYLPPEKIAGRDEMKLASVLLLEQVKRGVFVPHCLETTTCDHFACAVGDLFGDGRAHLVVGNFTASRDPAMTDAVVVWKNLGPRAEKAPATKP